MHPNEISADYHKISDFPYILNAFNLEILALTDIFLNIFFSSFLLDTQDKNYFWISKSFLVQKETSKWTSSNTVPFTSKWNPIIQCTSWYWYDMELCIAQRALANEWMYDICNEKKYFVCEYVNERGRKVYVKYRGAASS